MYMFSTSANPSEVLTRWRQRINSLESNDNSLPYRPYSRNYSNSSIISKIQSINKVTECDIIQELINKNEDELIDLKKKLNKCNTINRESVKKRRTRRTRKREKRGKKTSRRSTSRKRTNNTL